MDGCTVGAVGVFFVMHVLHSHSHDTEGHTFKLSSAALSYAILISGTPSENVATPLETISSVEQSAQLNDNSMNSNAKMTDILLLLANSSFETTNEMDVNERNRTRTTSSVKSRGKVFGSTETLLASSTERNISSDAANSSLQNNHLMKVTRQKGAGTDKAYLYILTIVFIACGLASMTIFSLVYFNSILPQL